MQGLRSFTPSTFFTRKFLSYSFANVSVNQKRGKHKIWEKSMKCLTFIKDIQIET